MTSEPPPYPRVPHLFAADERTRDDLVLSAEERELFLAQPVAVEEKLDGANVMLWLGPGGSVRSSGRSGAGALDRAGQLGRLRAWVAERTDLLRAVLERDRVLYAEWLFLTHTVHYSRLPDLLVGTDLHENGAGFLSADDRDEVLEGAGLAPPPRLFGGALGGEERLVSLFGRSAFGDEPAEGLVLRRERDGRLLGRAKALRPGFVRISDEEWQTGGRGRNAVAEGTPLTR